LCILITANGSELALFANQNTAFDQQHANRASLLLALVALRGLTKLKKEL